MKVIGAYAAKTHFSQLLDEVQAGEEVAITRNGRTVARIVPPTRNREDVRRVVDELLEVQNELSSGGLSIRKMVEYGRRF